MKIYFQLAILFLFIFLSACKNNNMQPPHLEGTWRLVAAGSSSEIKDKQIAVFQEHEYRILVNDLQLKATTYRMELAKTDSGKMWKIITQNLQTSYVKIINDSLYINSTEDKDGPSLIYVRAQL